MLCGAQTRAHRTPLKDGWGICTDGKSLIISDSSAVLVWVDPSTMAHLRSVKVHDGDRSIPWINEARTPSPAATPPALARTCAVPVFFRQY